MKTYKVTYTILSPGSDCEEKTAYGIANDFGEAARKVEKNEKTDIYTDVKVLTVELLDSKLFL